jgi:hypothetical protein
MGSELQIFSGYYRQATLLGLGTGIAQAVLMFWLLPKFMTLSVGRTATLITAMALVLATWICGLNLTVLYQVSMDDGTLARFRFLMPVLAVTIAGLLNQGRLLGKIKKQSTQAVFPLYSGNEGPDPDIAVSEGLHSSLGKGGSRAGGAILPPSPTIEHVVYWQDASVAGWIIWAPCALGLAWIAGALAAEKPFFRDALFLSGALHLGTGIFFQVLKWKKRGSGGKALLAVSRDGLWLLLQKQSYGKIQWKDISGLSGRKDMLGWRLSFSAASGKKFGPLLLPSPIVEKLLPALAKHLPPAKWAPELRAMAQGDA